MTQNPVNTRLIVIASTCLIGLIVLCLAWELWLAPLRPGGSWLVLKALPLVLPLAGIFAGRRYTYQWACMFILFYFAEGIVRSMGDTPPSTWLAMIEVALAFIFFITAIAYAKRTGAPRVA